MLYDNFPTAIFVVFNPTTTNDSSDVLTPEVQGFVGGDTFVELDGI